MQPSQLQEPRLEVHVQDCIDEGATLCNGGAVGGCVPQRLTKSGLGQSDAGLKEVVLEFLDEVGTVADHGLRSCTRVAWQGIGGRAPSDRYRMRLTGYGYTGRARAKSALRG